MGWIFYCAEQVAGVLQGEVFEDGKHLRDSLCPWSRQGREELQLQRLPRWAKGWTRVRGGIWEPQTPGHPSGVPILSRSCFFGALARGTDAVEATWDMCGLRTVAVPMARTLDAMAAFLRAPGLALIYTCLLHGFDRAKTH